MIAYAKRQLSHRLALGSTDTVVLQCTYYPVSADDD